MSLLVAQFCASSNADSLWWGADATTPLKDLKSKDLQLSGAIKRETDLQASRSMSLYAKELAVIIALVEVVANHGKDSEEFGKMFDQQQALASMEPKISFTLPGHLRSSRHSQLVTGLEQSDQWLARVASQDLINAGTAKPAEEQLFMFSSAWRAPSGIRTPTSVEHS